MDLENYHFAAIRVIADSSLWIIKPCGENVMSKYDILMVSKYLPTYLLQRHHVLSNVMLQEKKIHFLCIISAK